ncbi:hypothetical protein J4Q44_G00353430 [Coregonus suidteri]|uniref:Uncharacterized protein n=1 Tax=Coregonus suidteri TaxID=861788 RepID=A0AAN8QFE1_9TELE
MWSHRTISACLGSDVNEIVCTRLNDEIARVRFHQCRPIETPQPRGSNTTTPPPAPRGTEKKPCSDPASFALNPGLML